MADNQEPYQLVALSDEEAKTTLDAFENFKHAHKVDLSARAIISDDGRLGAEVRFFKKVSLVPKDEGFQPGEDNGGGASVPVAA